MRHSRSPTRPTGPKPTTSPMQRFRLLGALPLAQSFDRNIRPTRYGSQLARRWKGKRVPRGDIEQLGERISLDELPKRFAIRRLPSSDGLQRRQSGVLQGRVRRRMPKPCLAVGDSAKIPDVSMSATEGWWSRGETDQEESGTSLTQTC